MYAGEFFERSCRMRIESVARRFYEHAALLACPICRAPLSPAPPASVRCQSGHCFDLSGKGYASFAVNLKPSKYEKPLFESRRAVFDAQFYTPVVNALADFLRRSGKAMPVVADIGCGDGYYTRALSSLVPGVYIALDIVREAVALGARGGNDALWCVGDLAHLPIADQCVDVLLDVLTPSNYAEFTRVLAPEGRLIKVIPGPDYLKQLRALLGEHLRSGAYSQDRVREYLAGSMHLLGEERLSYTLPVTPALARDFARMTPMTLGVDVDTLELDSMHEVTIDLTILCAAAR